MGFVRGTDGDVRIGSDTLRLNSFTINRTGETADTTVFGSSWRTNENTIKSWTAEVSGLLDSTQSQQLSMRDQLEDGSFADLAVQFLLGSNTSVKKYNGNARVSGDVVTSDVGSMVAWRCSLIGNGALTWTAS